MCGKKTKMKCDKEIKEEIEILRKEYQELNAKFPNSDLLIDQLRATIAGQIKILRWVLE